MERVLRNLIENALRYTDTGGAVTLSATPGAEGAVLEVSDTGIGIPAEELPRIFDRFYRIEKSRGLAAGNAGLGLAITKRILDLHGSTITVTSEPGKTVFGFTVPYTTLAARGVQGAIEDDEAVVLPNRRAPAFTYPMTGPTA